MKKKWPIYLFCFLIVLILVGILAFLLKGINLDKIHQEKLEKELANTIIKIKDTDEILVTDNFNDYKKTSQVKEEDAKEIISILEEATLDFDNNSSGEERYTLELKKDGKVIATVLYSSSIFKINNQKLAYNINLGNLLSQNYSASLKEVDEELSKTLDKITKIVVKDGPSEKVLKEYTTKKEIEKIANILKEAKLWEGGINVPGNINYYEFYIAEEKVMTLENNGNYTLEYQNRGYILHNFEHEKLEELLNN